MTLFLRTPPTPFFPRPDRREHDMLGIATTILRGARRMVLSSKSGNKEYFKGGVWGKDSE